MESVVLGMYRLHSHREFRKLWRELLIGEATMCTELMVNILTAVAPLLKIMNKIQVSLLFAYQLSKLKYLELSLVIQESC